MKRNNKKTPLVKKIQSVARRTTLKLIETKKDVVLSESFNTFTGSSSFFYAFVNVFSPLSLNSSFQSGLIGDAFQDPLLVAKIQWVVNLEQLRTFVADNTLRPIWIHAWLVSTNDQIATVTGTPQTYNIIAQNWFQQPTGPNATMNGDNVKVLKHWVHQVSYASLLATGTTDRTITNTMAGFKHIKYKWKGTKRFEEDSGSTSTPNPQIRAYLKNQNYYLVLGWTFQYGVQAPATQTNTAVDFRVDRYLYYKDA